MTFLTEDQARGRWCPMYRVAECVDGGMTPNTFYGASTCAASNCMAWRWSRIKETSAFLTAVKDHMKETGENFNKATQAVYADAEKYRHTEGYCGLAGKPEGGE